MRKAPITAFYKLYKPGNMKKIAVELLKIARYLVDRDQKLTDTLEGIAIDFGNLCGRVENVMISPFGVRLSFFPSKLKLKVKPRQKFYLDLEASSQDKYMIVKISTEGPDGEHFIRSKLGIQRNKYLIGALKSEFMAMIGFLIGDGR